MRIFTFALLLIAVLSGPAVAVKEPIIGQAAFFYLGEPTDEESAVYDDFSWYLNGISPWLEEQGVVVSFHSKLPFTIQSIADQKLNFNRGDFELDLGFILVKPDGRFEIHYGVHTGVDIQLLVREYFRPNAD